VTATFLGASVPQVVAMGAADVAELLRERTVILVDVLNDLAICRHYAGVVRAGN